MTSSTRRATITRTTRETDITLELDLDGSGQADVETGIGFLDHMLTALTRHARFDLKLRCEGDLDVDGHHTVGPVRRIGDAVLDPNIVNRVARRIELETRHPVRIAWVLDVDDLVVLTGAHRIHVVVIDERIVDATGEMLVVARQDPHTVLRA